MKRPTQWRGHAPDRQTFRYPREEQHTTTDNLAAITYTRIYTMHEPTKTPTLCVFYRSYAMHFTFLLGRLKYARLINIYLVSLFKAIKTKTFYSTISAGPFVQFLMYRTSSERFCNIRAINAAVTNMLPLSNRHFWTSQLPTCTRAYTFESSNNARHPPEVLYGFEECTKSTFAIPFRRETSLLVGSFRSQRS